MRSALLALVLAGGALAYDAAAPARLPKLTSLLVVVAVVAGVSIWRGKILSLGAGSRWLLALGAWLALSAVWGGPTAPAALAAWGALVLLAVSAPGMAVDARPLAEGVALFGGLGTSVVVLSGLSHGGHGNPNWAGLFLAPAIVITLGCLVRARSPARALWCSACLGAALAALWECQSRVAIGALVFALVAFAVAPRLRRPVHVLGGGLVALQVVAVVLPRSALDDVLSGRLWLWRVSLEVARNELPFGVGVGDFSTEFLAHQGAMLQRADFAAERYHHAVTAHGEWLELLAVAGVPGLVLAGVWLAKVASALEKRWRWGAAATYCLAVSMVGDSSLHVPAVALLVALVSAAATVPSRKPAPRAGLGVLPWAGVLLSAGWLVSGVGAQWLAYRDRFAAESVVGTERARLLARAVNRAPREPTLALERGLELAQSGPSSAAEAELRRAVQLEATPSSWTALGNLQQRAGRPAEAARSYQAALQLNPRSFRALANYAAVLVELGDTEGARATLKRAQAIYPGRPELRETREQLRRLEIDQVTGGRR